MENQRERREQHQALVHYAATRLGKAGIKNLSYEAKIPGCGRVDIQGFRGNKRIAVECYAQVQPSKIRKKLLLLGKAVDRLIVCVPEYEERKLDGFDVEVWTHSAQKPHRIVIGDNTYEKLLRVSQNMGINKGLPGTVDETIERLIDFWKERH